MTIKGLPSPCFVLDEKILGDNIKKIKQFKELSNTRLLIALKANANHQFFHYFNEVADGFSISSVNEAKIVDEYGFGETHAFSPVYTKD